MKHLLKKSERTEWLNQNWRYSALTFRYSGGAHGNIVKVLDQRQQPIKYARCTGGGYDMTGTCLGQFIEHNFPEEIKRLNAGKYYGLIHYNPKRRSRVNKSSADTRTTLDGACGFSSMQAILYRIGFKMRYITETSNTKIYTLEVV